MVSKKIIFIKSLNQKMTSFKVSINCHAYTKGVADELVEQGCYAIDIYNSDHRTRQRTSVQIGDTLYMVRGNDYWVGTVTSDWLQMPMHNGMYHPFGFFHSVNGKRKHPLDVDHDEWVCKVNWGVHIPFPPTNSQNVDDIDEEMMEMKEWLNEGFNAITIKPLPSRATAAYVIRKSIRESKKSHSAFKKNLKATHSQLNLKWKEDANTAKATKKAIASAKKEAIVAKKAAIASAKKEAIVAKKAAKQRNKAKRAYQTEMNRRKKWEREIQSKFEGIFSPPVVNKLEREEPVIEDDEEYMDYLEAWEYQGNSYLVCRETMTIYNEEGDEIGKWGEGTTARAPIPEEESLDVEEWEHNGNSYLVCRETLVIYNTDGEETGKWGEGTTTRAPIPGEEGVFIC
jgi:hypothetical protein